MTFRLYKNKHWNRFGMQVPFADPSLASLIRQQNETENVQFEKKGVKQSLSCRKSLGMCVRATRNNK